MKTWDKSPSSTLEYIWDWTEWLGNDSIAEFTLENTPGIVIDSFIKVDQKIIVWVSGGTLNEHETVTCKVETVGGRKEERTAIFDVKQR